MSALEDTLLLHLKAAGLPLPQREFTFHPSRRWRFDFAWPDRMLACEVDGGTWVRGGHSRGHGQRRDAQKQNAATLAGWAVLRFTTDMVTSGEAVTTIQQALGG